MIRKIIEIGHPALREVAETVPKADIASKEIQRLVDDLIDTMRYANGAGLAATQIAVPLRVCVIEVKKNPLHGRGLGSISISDLDISHDVEIRSTSCLSGEYSKCAL